MSMKLLLEESFIKIKNAIKPAENTLFFLLVIVIGVCGGFAAVAFRSCTALLMGLYSGSFKASLLDIAQASTPVLKIVIPATGGLIAGIIVFIGLKERKGEGISEIMEALTLKGTRMELKQIIMKSFSSLVLLSTGGSIGREGPIVQLGAGIASKIAEVLSVSRDRLRILIGCGVAAGMSAAYNAPIGASFFVMEIIIGNFAMDIFGPVILASIVATVISRTSLGAGPLYAIPHLSMSSTWELLAYALLGIACAVVVLLFTAAIRSLERAFGFLPLPHMIKMAGGGIAIGVMAFKFPQVWGNGYEGVSQILNGELIFPFLGLLLLMKILATGVTVGSGGSGGIFTPTLFIGACLGGIFGNGVNSVFPDIAGNAGGYALAGMGGVIAALTHAPITAILIIFELTQQYDMILPLMLTSAVAGFAARSIRKESFYTYRLSRRGIKLDLEFEEAALRSVLVEDIMKKDVKLIDEKTRLDEILGLFLATRSNYLYVGDAEGNFMGVIDLHDIKETFAEREPKDLVIAWDLIKEVPMVTPKEPIAEIMEKFWFHEMGHLPVIQGNGSRRFLGIITRRDVIGAFDREILKRKMLLTRYLRKERGEDITSYLPLPEELAIREVPLPSSCEEKTLKEIDLSGRFNLNVLAIKRISLGGIDQRFLPHIDLRLQRNDILIILGRIRDVNRFLKS